MGKRRFKLTKKGIFTIGGVVVLLFAMAGIGLFVWWLQNKDRLPVQESGLAGLSENRLNATAHEAQNLALDGQPEEANKKLEEALAQQNIDNNSRSQLLLQQGLNYANGGNQEKALAAYLEADKLNSTFTTSHVVGETYAALGNKEKAIDYLKKALTQMNQDDPGYNADKTYYENMIKELGGSL